MAGKGRESLHTGCHSSTVVLHEAGPFQSAASGLRGILAIPKAHFSAWGILFVSQPPRWSAVRRWCAAGLSPRSCSERCARPPLPGSTCLHSRSSAEEPQRQHEAPAAPATQPCTSAVLAAEGLPAMRQARNASLFIHAGWWQPCRHVRRTMYRGARQHRVVHRLLKHGAVVVQQAARRGVEGVVCVWQQEEAVQAVDDSLDAPSYRQGEQEQGGRQSA